MSRLTWADILIEHVDPEALRYWFEPWGGRVAGQVAPIFLNKLGSWFLLRAEGHVEMLDVLIGQIRRVADSHDELVRMVNQQWWQEAYLLSDVVFELHEAGKIPGPGQCYALAPHPALGGPNPANGDAVNPRFVQITDVPVWQSICAQSIA